MTDGTSSITMDPPTAGNVAARRQKEALKREELCRGTFDTNHANSASVVTLIRTCLPGTSNFMAQDVGIFCDSPL